MITKFTLGSPRRTEVVIVNAPPFENPATVMFSGRQTLSR